MLIAGNWKMHTNAASATALATEVAQVVGPGTDVLVAVCPPFVNLGTVAHALDGSPVRLGAQNMHAADQGAYTGEVSADMLRAAGCHYVILGHSERRQWFQETDEDVRAKVGQALRKKLVPIVCVGESLAERKSGQAEPVVATQVTKALESIQLQSSDDLVIAYEPVWAIGTGETATPDQAQQIHAWIRSILADHFGDAVAAGIHILYGGSMKPSNAAELLSQPDVDGGLIGGASLRAADFGGIIQAARQ